MCALFSLWKTFEHRRVSKQQNVLPDEVLKRYEKRKDIVAISGSDGLKQINIGFQAEGGREIDFNYRQRWDGRGNLDVEIMVPVRLAKFAGICGKTLASAHARSSDAMMIRCYIGDEETLDNIMIGYAER